jgi:hypothetical protein
MSWDSEFGASYKVPKKLLDLADAGVLEDVSWHNDISPSFERKTEGGYSVRLWVEHPDLDQREAGGSRFMITMDDPDGAFLITVIETDKLDEALRVLRTMLTSTGAAWPG